MLRTFAMTLMFAVGPLAMVGCDDDVAEIETPSGEVEVEETPSGGVEIETD